LQFVDDDDDDVNTRDVNTDSTVPEGPAVSSESRYPRRERQAPSRFNDYVSLNNVSDGVSA